MPTTLQRQFTRFHSLSHSAEHFQVSLNRAARTDAGVHAAGNVISIKLITEIPGVPDLVARINEELPPEIRIWKIVSLSPHSSFETYAR